MDIFPLIFISILVLVIINLWGLPEGFSWWMRPGLPLYEKLFTVKPDQKLSTYIRAINEQDLYPPLDCKRKRPQEYLVISYSVMGGRHNRSGSQNLVPFTHGVLRYWHETGRLQYSGYLSVFWPLAIVGLILIPPWLDLEVETIPILLGIGVFVVLIVGTFLKHRYVSGIIREAIEKTENETNMP